MSDDAAQRGTDWIAVALAVALLVVIGLLAYKVFDKPDPGPLEVHCDGHRALIYEQDKLVLRVIYPHDSCPTGRK